MKRIVLLVCGLVLVCANSAEARRRRWSNNTTYSRPVAAAPASVAKPVTAMKPVTDDSQKVVTAAATEDAEESGSSESSVATASAETAVASNTNAATVKTVSYSTQTAQGVANLMASYNRVGHFGGNRGYEGCGCGATPAAAYSVCCYGNSGMATVDVGYARSASGTWYCCRRYR
jgi:hypothetical protein